MENKCASNKVSEVLLANDEFLREAEPDKNNALVSIIIPVYNSEQYLDKCIESVKSQTYKNIEILLIDDGSKDNSGKMCDDYAKEDTRVRVFHKKNGGQGSARNLGMEKANGEYLSFVDSDDTIDVNYIKYLMDCLKLNNCCVALCNVTTEQKLRYENFDNFFNDLLSDTLGGQLWRFVFAKNLWKDIRIPESRYAEDAMVIYKVLCNVKKIGVVDKELYKYNTSNADSSSNKPKNLLKNTIDRAIMFIERVQWMDGNWVVEAETKNTVLRKATEFSIGALGCYKQYVYEENDINFVINFIKDNFKKIILNEQLSFSRKIAVLIIWISPSVYYKIRNLW